MTGYLKALTPLLVGLVVGVILLLSGDKTTGSTVLVAVAGASGISFVVPNRG